MKIEIGTSRIALVTERFAVKIPKINFGILRDFFLLLRKRDVEGLKIFLQTHEEDAGIKYALFRGLMQNRREARYSRELADIVVPTRLSFFGILNVQDIAPPIEIDISEIVIALRTATEGNTRNDFHTFCNEKNYGTHDGRIKFRDYGGIDTIPVLLKYQDTIANALRSLVSKK